MLVLSRRAGEGLWIGDETEVIVIGCQGNSVKIGVRAPRNVLILRTELKMVEQQNRAATQPCPGAALDDLAARLRSFEK